jgi:flagellar motor switch protein FliN
MGDGSLSQQEIDDLLEGNVSEEETEDIDNMSGIGDAKPTTTTTIDDAPTKAISKKVGTPSVGNLDLLLDVKMNLVVELGRTKIEVKDVLDLGSGSVVELDKFTGEPVDLFINNRLVARGDVIAIDESFGIKVSEIIDPEERLKINM